MDRCPSAPEAFKELSDLYEGRQRCGVFQKGQGTEVYLLPGCELSERILKTVIRAAPPDIRSEIPRVVGADEMLLLFVHRRVRHSKFCQPLYAEILSIMVGCFVYPSAGMLGRKSGRSVFHCG